MACEVLARTSKRHKTTHEGKPLFTARGKEEGVVGGGCSPLLKRDTGEGQKQVPTVGGKGWDLVGSRGQGGGKTEKRGKMVGVV